MNTDAQTYLAVLASMPSHSFENRFASNAGRLSLASTLTRDELTLLYDAAFLATLCNIAFNGLGGCGGEIKPEREGVRRTLEQEFMAARDTFRRCSRWSQLSPADKAVIESSFLWARVAENNLAQ